MAICRIDFQLCKSSSFTCSAASLRQKTYLQQIVANLPRKKMPASTEVSALPQNRN